MRGPILLTVLGFLLAYVPVHLGWADLPGFLPEIVLGAGLVWMWLRARTRGRRVTAGLLTAVGLFHVVWLFGLSRYDAPAGAPAVGSRAPDVDAIRVRDGARFNLAEQRGRDVLLVFFRGAW